MICNGDHVFMLVLSSYYVFALLFCLYGDFMIVRLDQQAVITLVHTLDTVRPRKERAINELFIYDYFFAYTHIHTHRYIYYISYNI